MLLFFPASLVVTACPSGAELENADAFAEGNCNVEAILESSCSGAACHQGTPESAPGGAVEFFDAAFPESLLDLPAEYPGVTDPENCPNEAELIVDRTAPNSSLMLLKVRGEHSCGEAMPLPYPALALSATEIGCLERWVIELVEGSESGRGGAGGGTTGESP